MLDTGDLVTIATAIGAIVTAYVTVRKLRVESRDSIIASFQKLIDEQRKEMDRIQEQRKEREAELQAAIDELNAQVIKSRADRERQLGELALTHSTELAKVQADCKQGKDELTIQVREQLQTIRSQTSRIRALERQLGINDSGK